MIKLDKSLEERINEIKFDLKSSGFKPFIEENNAGFTLSAEACGIPVASLTLKSLAVKFNLTSECLDHNKIIILKID